MPVGNGKSLLAGGNLETGKFSNTSSGFRRVFALGFSISLGFALFDSR
jgi:hypothetical protein